MQKKLTLPFLLLWLLGSAAIAWAEEKDHSKMDHSKMNHSKMDGATHEPYIKGAKGELSTLKQQPASGRAREAGSDGRYNMESTTASNSLATRCAQASRGLVMLDNASWARCGGKAKGIAEGPGKAKAVDHSQH